MAMQVARALLRSGAAARPKFTIVSLRPLACRDAAECRKSFFLGRVFLDGAGGNESMGEERRRSLNRLLYRSKQRGFLELDLVLGKWTQDNIHHLDDKQLECLVQVLDLENPDLWTYLTGQAEVPEFLSANPVFQSIQTQVTDNLQAYSSLRTRAKPGQPWVRGWDDFKKTGPSNMIGNQ